MLKHKQAKPNPKRHQILKTNPKLYKVDGLKNLK